MGDGEQGTRYVELSESWQENPHSKPICVKVVYKPGPKGWAGIFWQNIPDNWGSQPGEDFRKAGYRRITLWARGERGNEVIEFKAGGINAPGKTHRDSFVASAGKITLEKDWKRYVIDLDGKDLSSVIGGFAWTASSSANPDGATFYLDDVSYEK
jgi:hypothetical protein